MANKLNVFKKVASIAGIVIASLLIISAFCGRFCNTPETEGFMHFANFFVGSFGMSFYGLMAAVIVACSFSLAGKTVKIPAKYIVHFALMFIAVILFVHTLTTTYLPKDFHSHMSLIYHYYDNQMGIPTFGGVVFGLIAWCLTSVLTVYGASIVIFLLLAWTVYVAGDFFYKYFTGRLSLEKKNSQEDNAPMFATTVTEAKPTEAELRQANYDRLFRDGEQSVTPQVVSRQDSVGRYDIAPQSGVDSPRQSPSKEDAAKILFGHGGANKGKGVDYWGETQRERREDDYLVKGYYPNTESQPDEKPNDSSSNWKISHVPSTQSQPDTERPQNNGEENAVRPVQTGVTQQPAREEPTPIYIQPQTEQADVKPSVTQPQTQTPEPVYDDELDISDLVIDDMFSVPDTEEIVVQPEEPTPTFDTTPRVVEQPRREEFVISQPPKHPEPEEEDLDEIVVVPRYDEVEGGVQEGMEFITKGELKEAQSSIHQYLEYNIPPMDLLNDVTIIEDNDDGERQRLAQAIVNKLAVFNIKIELADIIVGPTVTRYMFTVLSQKTRMSDFKQYSDDIKACVEAQDDILIEAPVKGTNMVGIEVPNKRKRPVVLRELLESPAFKEAKGDLIFAIGQEVSGKVVVGDLADMPHLLVAGTTGSGKSVCLNCLIVSMMYKYGPEYLRFVMVDPKFVELSRYNGIPHMLTAETITTMQDALAGMDYLIEEMEARYKLFRQTGVDKISEYNKRLNPKLAQKLPYLVFIVDELADLMNTNKSAFETKLMRLAQKARAAGIHIVLATQRPDVKVITGTIKGNLPSRMALKVSSVYDSQTIIGGGGAEKLLGKGDMLFMNSSGSSDLTRVQGAYISNDEIRALVKYSAEVNEVYYDSAITEQIFVTQAQAEAKRREEEAEKNGGGEDRDELYPFYKKALRYWLEHNGGKASISSIQRALKVGFNRAGRIMENLQKMGYVEELSSSDTSNRAVRVLVTLEELDELFPDDED